VLTFFRLAGTAALRVSLSGYDKAAMTGVAAATSRPAWTRPVGRDFDITLVHNVRLIPPKLSLYNHPDNKVRIFSVGGSGYSQIQLNDTAIAAVTHQLGGGEISITPKMNGILKVTVIDVCLAGSDPAHGVVHVSNVAAIRIKSRDMIKIGDQMPVQVDLLDSYGAPFESSQLKWVDIKIHVDGSALDVVQIGSATSQYTATGRHLGVSTISVSAVDPVTGATVSSAPLQVHVFPPFQVSPSKLELMPGAQFQLGVSGGPPFRSEITFDIANDTIATVSKDGFVSAQPLVQSGRTTITVSIWSRVSGGDPQEKPQRAGTAVVDVEVHHLRGIRIQSSSPRLLLGEETSLRVEGLDGENPFAWGGLDVNFKWEVVNPDVVALAPIFENANVTLDEEHGFTVRVRGLKPGTTRISVRVTAGPASLTGKTSSMFLEIIPPLTLTGLGRRWEASSQDLLLLAPGASYLLLPNIANAVIKYSVVSDTPCNTAGDEVSIVKLDERHNSNSVLLQSSGLAGQTMVHAKDRTDGQVSVVKVAVKPVYHVELRPRVSAASVPSTHALLGQQASSYRFPVGSLVEFDLILRDELGQEFDGFLGQSSSSVVFDAVVNRPDLVSVEIVRSSNSSASLQESDSAPSETAASAIVVRVRGLRPGRATIMVRLAQPSTIASPTTPEGNLQFTSSSEWPMPFSQCAQSCT
jgi:nuclear pore complex protein Nup210